MTHWSAMFHNDHGFEVQVLDMLETLFQGSGTLGFTSTGSSSQCIASGYESAGPPGAQTFLRWWQWQFLAMAISMHFGEGPKPTFWWATSALVLLCQMLKEPGSPMADGGWVVIIGMIILHSFLWATATMNSFLICSFFEILKLRDVRSIKIVTGVLVHFDIFLLGDPISDYAWASRCSVTSNWGTRISGRLWAAEIHVAQLSESIISWSVWSKDHRTWSKEHAWPCHFMTFI